MYRPDLYALAARLQNIDDEQEESGGVGGGGLKAFERANITTLRALRGQGAGVPLKGADVKLECQVGMTEYLMLAVSVHVLVEVTTCSLYDEVRQSVTSKAKQSKAWPNHRLGSKALLCSQHFDELCHTWPSCQVGINSPSSRGGTSVRGPHVDRRAELFAGRGLHSSTFRLNVSAFCAIGGAFRVSLRGVYEVVLRRC